MTVIVSIIIGVALVGTAVAIALVRGGSGPVRDPQEDEWWG